MVTATLMGPAVVGWVEVFKARTVKAGVDTRTATAITDAAADGISMRTVGGSS